MQKKVPYVAQLGNMDCSIACMTMLFRYYGLDVDIVDVGQVVHIGRDGVNLTQLKQATQQFGFKCTAYRYNKQKNILDSNLPAVVYSGSHLAVIGSKTVLGQYILLDPIKGKSIVNFEQIHDTFSDILITIRPEKRIKRKKCKPKLKVAINYKLVAGIISLMLLIQALTLSIPLVEQALIDSITQSQSLLNSAYILVGCIVIAGLYFFLSIARQKLMLRLDISFVKEIMTKMLKKLFDIDPSFFEWHAVGEIVNRFSNVQAINNIIINTFSQVAVQIITSTICLVTMFVYSPSLSVITIAIGTIELVLLLGINKKNREDTSKYIADQSNMQGLLIILAAVLLQTSFQQHLAAHHGAHCQLKASQPEIRRDEIHLWCRVIRAPALINALSVGEGLFIGNLHQKLCDCLFKVLLRRDTAVARQIALRIKVHHEYAVALLGKGNAQVIRGSRFARTALLVCDSNSFHLVSSCKISSKLIQCFWYSCVTCTSVSL